VSIPENPRRKIAAVLAVVALTAALSCGPRRPRTAHARRAAPAATDSLSVFFTGSTLGKLKPCGCSGGQLGGLERRPAVFNTVPAEKRMLIDTGSLVATNGDQDLIKFEIIVEALNLLDYSVVNLAADDFELAGNRGLLGNPDFGFISPYGPGDEAGVGFQNGYLLNGEPVIISVVTFDVDRSSPEEIKESFVPPEQGAKSVNILIVNRCDEDVISSIGALGVVDCIVCPSEAEDPMIIGSPNRRPLVFSVGRYGRHICKLTIEKARVRDRLKFKFTCQGQQSA
jgi:hypothetical protein